MLKISDNPARVTTATRVITEQDIMTFAAAGHTAEGFREYAASPGVVAMLAEQSGEAEEAVRALLVMLADGLSTVVPAPRAKEGWTGSTRCSGCAGNHVPGSRYCGCSCHTSAVASRGPR